MEILLDSQLNSRWRIGLKALPNFKCTNPAPNLEPKNQKNLTHTLISTCLEYWNVLYIGLPLMHVWELGWEPFNISILHLCFGLCTDLLLLLRALPFHKLLKIELVWKVFQKRTDIIIMTIVLLCSYCFYYSFIMDVLFNF